MKATYDISIVPAGHNAVHVYVYRDGVTRLNKTLKGQSVQAAAEAAKRLVTAELQSPLIRWKADGWNIWSAKLQHQEFVNARHQTSGRIPNSPFLTMPSRDMAEAFAAAARSAGHKSVLVSTVKGKPGVMLGNMDHAEARKLADVLNKRFPQADLRVNPQAKWSSFRDNIVKATVYYLVADGQTWRSSSHIDGHGIEVFGERKEAYRGGPKEMRYFPVVRYGPYGESEVSNDNGFKSVADAKDWAIKAAQEVGLLKKQNPYMGFERLKAQLRRKGVQDPAALAAAIGRKKYGKKAFQEMAAAGRRAARRNPEDLSNVYLRQVSWGDSNIQWDIISPEYGKIGQVDVISYRYKLGDIDSALLDVSTEENENVPESLIKGRTKEGPQYVLGPGVVRRLLQEVKRDVKRRFPNVKTLVGERTTGAKPGKVAHIKNPFEGAWKTMAGKKKATKRAKNPVQASGGIRTVGA